MREVQDSENKIEPIRRCTAQIHCWVVGVDHPLVSTSTVLLFEQTPISVHRDKNIEDLTFACAHTLIPEATDGAIEGFMLESGLFS